MQMIRYAEINDKLAWYRLDRHLPEAVFEEKVRNRQGYVCVEDGKIIGILRYGLSGIPFRSAICSLSTANTAERAMESNSCSIGRMK